MMFENKIKGFISQDLVQDTLKLSSSNVILYVLPLIVTPILSRVYSPENYGDWGIFSSIYMIISYVLFLSYDNAIIRTNDEKCIANLICLCVIISVLVIALVCTIFLCGYLINNVFILHFPRFDLLLIFLITCIFQNISIALANRFKRYTTMTISSIINGFFQSGLRILIGVSAIFTDGLIIGAVIANVISTLYILFAVKDVLICTDRLTITFSNIKELAIKYKKFPLYDAPSNILTFSTLQLVIVILSYYFTKGEVGCFSMITQFVLLPVAFIGSAISKVYYRKISSISFDIQNVKSVTIKVFKITTSLCFLPALFLIFGGDILIEWFLGSQWTTSGNMALCMAISSIPIILTEALLPIYRTLDKQNIRFHYDFILFVLTLGGLIITIFLTKNLLFSILVYSSSFSIVRFFMFRNILKLVNIKISEISNFFLIAVIICYLALLVRLLFSLGLVSF